MKAPMRKVLLSVIAGVLWSGPENVAEAASGTNAENPSTQTLSLLQGADNSVAMSATLDIGWFTPQTTFADMEKLLGGQNIADLRSSPEGLEVLAARFRAKDHPTSSEIKGFLDLCSPDYRQVQASSLANAGQEPALPPLKPFLLARFGPYTAISFGPVGGPQPGPLDDAIFVDTMIATGQEFEFTNPSPVNMEFGLRCFISIVSSCSSADLVAQDHTKDPQYTTISIPCVETNLPRKITRDREPIVHVSAKLQPLTEGSAFQFLSHVVDILSNGSDDQIKGLFDDSSANDVDSLFTTANDHAELDCIRMTLQAGHVISRYELLGKDIFYIIFSVSDASPVSSASSRACSGLFCWLALNLEVWQGSLTRVT